MTPSHSSASGHGALVPDKGRDHAGDKPDADMHAHSHHPASSRPLDPGALVSARGLSLADVSGTLGISQHTARAQLKSIFAKTGVSRQAELVRLVLKSVAALA